MVEGGEHTFREGGAEPGPIFRFCCGRQIIVRAVHFRPDTNLIRALGLSRNREVFRVSAPSAGDDVGPDHEQPAGLLGSAVSKRDAGRAGMDFDG